MGSAETGNPFFTGGATRGLRPKMEVMPEEGGDVAEPAVSAFRRGVKSGPNSTRVCWRAGTLLTSVVVSYQQQTQLNLLGSIARMRPSMPRLREVNFDSVWRRRSRSASWPRVPRKSPHPRAKPKGDARRT